MRQTFSSNEFFDVFKAHFLSAITEKPHKTPLTAIITDSVRSRSKKTFSCDPPCDSPPSRDSSGCNAPRNGSTFGYCAVEKADDNVVD